MINLGIANGAKVGLKLRLTVFMFRANTDCFNILSFLYVYKNELTCIFPDFVSTEDFVYIVTVTTLFNDKCYSQQIYHDINRIISLFGLE